MDSTKRIIINTIVQYLRSVLNILLSLFSTRYIVAALGLDDYGLYILIGGVVALLSFITNALVITTQRYISYYHGKADFEKTKRVFSNSLFIHIVLSLLMAVILIAIKDILIYQWLNISVNKTDTAMNIYYITIVMLVVTFLIAPFKALLIAHENIVFISFVEITDAILKLGVAIWILFTDTNRLLLYTALMASLQVLNFFVFYIYSIRQYKECQNLSLLRQINISFLVSIAEFAGWSIYSMGAVVLRNQGLQVILNRIFGTIVNAAYGIALQVFGSIAFIASSVLNAMNPQIIQAEGENNRQRMLQLSEMESKYSTMLLMLIVIPLMFEIKGILSFWLIEVPTGTEIFCIFILASFIIDQSTYGINTVNQAIGKIKLYTLLMYTPKILVLIPIYYLLTKKNDITIIMWVYLLSELIVAFARLPYLKYTCGHSILHFCNAALFPLLPLLITQCTIGYLCNHYIEMSYRFLLTIPISLVIGLGTIWIFTLSKSERDYAIRLITSKMSRTAN